MKKIKNVVIYLLSLAMVTCLAVAGTIAYLTDTDDDVNVMTLGNVKIEQIEKQWNEDQSALEDFKDGKPLYPYVGQLGWENTDNDDGAYRRFTMNNVVDKYVTVKNTGKSDAYVRTYIALEMGKCTVEEMDTYVGVALNTYNGSEFKFDGAWRWIFHEAPLVINNENYQILEAVHVNPVEPGQETIPSLLQVYLKDTATNEIVEKLDGNGDGKYNILVVSQAIQTKGFESAVSTISEDTFTAKKALDTGFGEVSAKTFEGAYKESQQIVLVSSVDDMREAMKVKGAKLVLSKDITIDDDKGTGYALYAKYDCEIDLNGHTLAVDMDGKEFYGVIYALNGAKVNIAGDGNIEVNDGVGQWIWATGANGATEVNIYGGNWIQDSDDFNKDDNKYCEGIYANRKAAINIYGGTFEWGTVSEYTVNESREGVITIYGGTFINFDPGISHSGDEGYVAEGYKVIEETQTNGDVWYTVVPE